MSKFQRTNGMSSEVRVVVEVDGHPVGVLDLDVDRLWPLIHHRGGDAPAVEWIDPTRYGAALRAAVTKKMRERLQSRLHPILGDDIVKMQLEVENLALRAEAAAQEFGRTHADVEKLAKESNRTAEDFDVFFWDYVLGEREVDDLRKEWKASSKRAQ